MDKVNWMLDNVEDILTKHLTPEKTAKTKTLFLKHLAEQTHRFYGGKMQTVPKAGVFGFNWFNVWYTPLKVSASFPLTESHEFT